MERRDFRNLPARLGPRYKEGMAKKKDILKDDIQHLRTCVACLEEPAREAKTEELDAVMFQLQHSLAVFWKKWRTL